ncbi:MAG: hypothetical protein WCZ89_01475 [Phycisphaerae bacterium]
MPCSKPQRCFVFPLRQGFGGTGRLRMTVSLLDVLLSMTESMLSVLRRMTGSFLDASFSMTGSMLDAVLE